MPSRYIDHLSVLIVRRRCFLSVTTHNFSKLSNSLACRLNILQQHHIISILPR